MFMLIAYMILMLIMLIVLIMTIKLGLRSIKKKMKRLKAVKHNATIPFHNLPDEVLEEVFRLLSPTDLKSVVMVCRRWREVGEVPALWSWVRVEVNEDNMDYIPEVLDSSRMEAVKKIDFWGVKMSHRLLRAVARHPGLKEMRVDGDLSSVEPELLARAVVQLEEVDLRYTRLTTNQVNTIFTSMTGNCKLKTLRVCGNDLSTVEADVLAQAVTKVEEVDMSNCGLTPQQVTALCRAMEGNSKLKKLRICTATVFLNSDSSSALCYSYRNNLSLVDADTLAQAVALLEEVDLMDTQLTPLQVTSICTSIIGSSKLKSLAFCKNNLSTVNVRLLAQVVWKLDEVKLRNTHLTTRQAEAIFAALPSTEMRHKPRHLRPRHLMALEICDNNLSSVDPDVLAKGANMVDYLDLRCTQLTRQQVVKVLTHHLTDFTILFGLKIGGNGRIEEELVKDAKCHFKWVMKGYVRFSSYMKWQYD